MKPPADDDAEVKEHESNASSESPNPKTEADAYMLQFQNLQTRSDQVRQEYFYGRCLGFYYCPSAQRILLMLSSLMAGYGNTFLESKQGLSKIFYTVCRSVSSFLSPEDRAVVMTKLTREAGVQFCKAFWNFAEHPVVMGGSNVIVPQIAVAHAFELLPRKLRMPATSRHSSSEETDSEDSNLITIPFPSAHFGPLPVSVRLLSYRRRPGMDWASPNLIHSLLQTTKLVDKPTELDIHSSTTVLPQSSPNVTGGETTPDVVASNSPLDMPPTSSNSPGVMHRASSDLYPTDGSSLGRQSIQSGSQSDPTALSPYLLFHIHGGGFVALSAQSQDIFLRQWAKFLDCPIFSVDYSLAPQAPYPRALEECLFAYCWACLNRTSLGATPDARIVLCGDSAGGNLALGLCLRIIHAGIHPKPSGVLFAYAPILVSFTPSPSRMLSMPDPLLPIGVLSRCLLAYAGVPESQLDEPTSPDLSEVDASTSGVSSKARSRRLWTTPSPTNTSSAAPRFDFDRRSSLSVPANLSHAARFPSAGSTGRPFVHTAELDSPNSVADEMVPDENAVSSGPCIFDLPDSDNPGTPSRRPTYDDMLLGTERFPPSDLDRVRAIRFKQDAFMSPYLASDDLMSQLPPLGITVSNFDPFLDDCLELAKRANRLHVPVDLRVVEDLPHAFLNFAPLGPEFQRANRICMDMLKRLLEGTRPPPPPTMTPPSQPPSPQTHTRANSFQSCEKFPLARADSANGDSQLLNANLHQSALEE